MPALSEGRVVVVAVVFTANKFDENIQFAVQQVALASIPPHSSRLRLGSL